MTSGYECWAKKNRYLFTARARSQPRVGYTKQRKGCQHRTEGGQVEAQTKLPLQQLFGCHDATHLFCWESAASSRLVSPAFSSVWWTFPSLMDRSFRSPRSQGQAAKWWSSLQSSGWGGCCCQAVGVPAAVRPPPLSCDLFSILALQSLTLHWLYQCHQLSRSTHCGYHSYKHEDLNEGGEGGELVFSLFIKYSLPPPQLIL